MRTSFVRSTLPVLVLLNIFILIISCTRDNNKPSQPGATSQKSFFGGENDLPFRSLMANEAKQLIEKQSNLVILDLRSAQELREGTIEGATQVPYWVIMQNKLKLARQTPVLLLCLEGDKSFTAGHMMVKYGYTRVFNITGGLVAWKEAGFPVKYK